MQIANFLKKKRLEIAALGVMVVPLLAGCAPTGTNINPDAVVLNQPTQVSQSPSATPTSAPTETPIILSPTPISTASPPASPVPTNISTKPPPPPPPGKMARITYPSNGALLAGEWIDVYGDIGCMPNVQIEYWKFEFDNGGFIARFEPGMFSGRLLMHWKVASITALIGNNQTRNVRLVVVCKNGDVVTSSLMRYTFRQ